MLAHAARVGGLGVAALLSLATSSEVDEVTTTVPLSMETAVGLQVVPTVLLTSKPALDGAPYVALIRTADDAELAGELSVEQGSEGVELSFVPDEPLSPDTDYRFVVEGALAGYFYVDPVTELSVRLGENGAADELVIPFSTASDPQVRFARRTPEPRTVRVSFSQAMEPLTVSTNTVKVLDDGTERATQLVLYRGGDLHEAEVTLFEPVSGGLELLFTDGIEAADGTALTEVAVTID